jgi:hypothetical protein
MRDDRTLDQILAEVGNKARWRGGIGRRTRIDIKGGNAQQRPSLLLCAVTHSLRRLYADDGTHLAALASRTRTNCVGGVLDSSH